MLNYYHRNLSNFDTLEPLYKLLRKNIKWKCGEEQTKAFKRIKLLFCSKKLVLHYGPYKPLIFAFDTSPYGLGGVFSHVLADGTGKSIAYIPHTLTSSEKNYSQIEKESLAIVYSIKKFHQFLYGRHFNIRTDHKPF